MNKTVSQEVAKLAFEKGICRKEVVLGLEPLPTQTWVQTQLREKFRIFVFVQLDKTMEPKFAYDINKYVSTKNYDTWMNPMLSKWLYYTYEKALDAGLIEGLNLISIKDMRKEKLKRLEKL